MRIIGITGGTGCGKSSACGRLRELGFKIIDFDSMIRVLQEPGKPLYNTYIREFGEDIVNEDGTLNRQKIGSIVFNDKEKLEIMNEFASSKMDMELARNLDIFAEEGKDATRKDDDFLTKKVIFLDAPTLFETRLKYTVDEAWFIDADFEVRVERIMKRDGISREEILQRMSAQLSEDTKKSMSDVIIDNSSTLENLIANVDSAIADLDERVEENKKQYIYK